MTIEIEEVTVKDGIVRITALNCSEENLQKLERLRDDCYQKNYSLCLIPGIISPTVSTLLTGCTIRK